MYELVGGLESGRETQNGQHTAKKLAIVPPLLVVQEYEPYAY